jgi:hypothetical protein
MKSSPSKVKKKGRKNKSEKGRSKGKYQIGCFPTFLLLQP